MTVRSHGVAKWLQQRGVALLARPRNPHLPNFSSWRGRARTSNLLIQSQAFCRLNYPPRAVLRALARLHARLDELKAIAEWVVDVAAADPWDLLVEAYPVTCCPQGLAEICPDRPRQPPGVPSGPAGSPLPRLGAGPRSHSRTSIPPGLPVPAASPGGPSQGCPRRRPQPPALFPGHRQLDMVNEDQSVTHPFRPRRFSIHPRKPSGARPILTWRVVNPLTCGRHGLADQKTPQADAQEEA